MDRRREMGPRQRLLLLGFLVSTTMGLRLGFASAPWKPLWRRPVPYREVCVAVDFGGMDQLPEAIEQVIDMCSNGDVPRPSDVDCQQFMDAVDGGLADWITGTFADPTDEDVSGLNDFQETFLNLGIVFGLGKVGQTIINDDAEVDILRRERRRRSGFTDDPPTDDQIRTDIDSWFPDDDDES